LKITFVTPTYNEIENLPKLAESFFELPIDDLNLLVVDDNSPDGTGKMADDLCQIYLGKMHVLHRPGKLGLGSAYIQGFRYAIDNGAEAVGQMDADFSHPLDRIPALVNTLQSTDICLGSRYVPGGSVDVNWPLWRKGLSAWGNFYARTILGMQTRDVTGGYRLWQRHTLSSMPLESIRSNGYVFQVEMLYVASLLGFQCKEIPIYFADRRWGQSKMSFRIQLEAAIRVWQLRNAYHDLVKV
jgi:dolichol-phosphate mannosyltransferase